VRSDAEEVAEKGHVPEYGLARRFHDLAAAMNPSSGRDGYTAEAFSSRCRTVMAARTVERGAEFVGRVQTDSYGGSASLQEASEIRRRFLSSPQSCVCN
jgi:hypothetical protein